MILEVARRRGFETARRRFELEGRAPADFFLLFLLSSTG